MANAKKCDRCGRFYEERERSALKELANSLSTAFKPESPKPIFRNDLCENCEESLNKWWKRATKKELGTGRAIDVPIDSITINLVTNPTHTTHFESIDVETQCKEAFKRANTIIANGVEFVRKGADNEQSKNM